MAQGEERDSRLPRIVMIDDEMSNLQIVKIILAREHFECDLLLYDDARQALDYLRHNAVDLVLLDLAMPEVDGFEVLTRLKEWPSTMEIPVIFLSAYQETEYILKAFAMGAIDFIGKPIISPILTARIRHVIQARSLQKELQRSNKELLDTNRLKDELLSICSHDLRAPLSSIELICQFLSDAVAGESSQSMPELINRIVSQSRVARRLVENLLDLNRIEEGRLLPTSSFFPVDELVQSCLEDAAPALQARGIQYRSTQSHPGLLCYGDREMIAQVLRNVLNNASKHAHACVSLDCVLREHSQGSGGSLRITIGDDGPGIPSARQKSVFEKYAKLETQGSGSGLGLYISKQIVELHHGRIWAESNGRRGAAFVIELANIFTPEQLPELSDYHHNRILIASSSRNTAQALEGVLVEGGLIHVSQAHTCPALDDALRGQPPDIAVVDLHSPLLAEHRIQIGNRPQLPTHWILYGPSDLAQGFAGENNLRCTHMPAPLNALVYLRHIEKLLRTCGTSGTALCV